MCLWALVTLLLMAGVSETSGAEISVIRESRQALKLRDPFKRPIFGVEVEGPRSELERYATGELKLVGIMTGPTRMRAMVQAPDGRTYFLAERMRVGTRKGVVRKITSESVLINEKIVNVLGEEESVQVELKLQAGVEQ